MSNWYLVILSLIGLHGVYAGEEQKGLQAQVEIEVGPDDDDDYYYEEEAPEVWIGPGLYYGVWFDDEYEYHNWYRDHYYRGYDHDHRGYHHHDEHQGGHGGDHGSGGHHH